MEERRRNILKIIIKEYLKNKQPVSSAIVAEKYKLGISSATIRNEMAELEDDGFIVQPHTSAGRVPTEKAYNFYLGLIEIEKLKLSEDEKLSLRVGIKENNNEGFKQTAKIVAKISKEAVFWAFHRRDLYYTGISNLLTQPEFTEKGIIYDISTIIDRMDEILEKNFDKFDFGTQVMIGSANLFSRHCASITVKYRFGGQIGIVGILGPMRMDYDKNLAIIEFLNKELKEEN